MPEIKKPIRKSAIVSAFLDKDHTYIDKLWLSFISDQNKPDDLLGRFEKFKNRITLHIKLENDFLFPRLNRHLGFDGRVGPAASAYQDHLKIFKLMELVEQACRRGELKKIKTAGRHLDIVLKDHRLTEQKLHYPVSDSFISKNEWKAMFKKIYG